jgi:hypothetical protein
MASIPGKDNVLVTKFLGVLPFSHSLSYLQRRVEAPRLRAVDEYRARGAAAENHGGGMLRGAGLSIDSACLHILPHIAVVIGQRCFRVRCQCHVDRGARLGLLVAEESKNTRIIPSECGQGMHSVANLV